MTKKYQVFISSTYTDLVGERKAVEETIIRSGDFPVGMETFPAADDEQFTFIKSLIDSCDYFVLIVAGRYGSIAADGLSYTEKEFRYAVEKSIPVLVFVHSDRGSLAANKCETTVKGKRKLEAFIGLASNGRLRAEWSDVNTLKLSVREALDNAKRTKPRPGWIRDERALEKVASEVAEEPAQLSKNTERRDVDQVGGLQSVKISELALDMLANAVESNDGTILVADFIGGARISAGAKRYDLSAGQRAIARHKAAVEELLEYGLIEAVGYKGEIFRVTNDGYEAIERYNLRNP